VESFRSSFVVLLGIASLVACSHDAGLGRDGGRVDGGSVDGGGLGVDGGETDATIDVCPAGTYEVVVGTPAQCVACVVGEYCAGASAPSAPCIGDTWDDDASPATSCAARATCTEGEFVLDEGGATSDRTCDDCADGSFSTAENAASCTPFTACSDGWHEISPGTSTTDRTCVFPLVSNETDVTAEADFCNLQFPSSISVTSGQMSDIIVGRIFEVGVTETDGASASVLAEVGYGPSGSDPRTSTQWRFVAASFSAQAGNDDEYVGRFSLPGSSAGTYSYTYRFSFDSGASFTYCDSNGSGSYGGLTFEPAMLGTMTVTN